MLARRAGCVARSAIVSLVILLASCSSTHRGDGPPGFDVDVSHIKNPVPKPEPIAKYGNMPSYKVLGRRYYTMKSSDSFQQTGTASWYGTKFHDRRTSSGEPYDMLAMTAAHKTLPLPTYVEVTNLSNHRTIIVKVNDRGPFSSNRIIDLSYVAAKKLGMLGHGTAPVKIRALNPYTYAAEHSEKPARHITTTTTTTYAAHSVKTQTTTPTHYVYLQAGAFSNKANALSLKNRLASQLQLPVRLTAPTQSSKLYRVQVGPIYDTASAETISRRLQSIGVSAKKIQGG
jgi:rare lipoprotein A